MPIITIIFAGGLTGTWTYNPDGSLYELVYTGITGQKYTSTDTLYGANGKAVSQLWSNGSALYKSQTWNVDGSVYDIHYYAITGQAYTDYDVFYGVNGKPASAIYSNGMTQTWTYNADGSLYEIINIGITGQKYTATDVVYGSNGKVASQTWSNGAGLVKSQSWNADGSVRDVHTYGVTGQAYTDYDVVYGSNGKESYATYSNGMTQTWSYNANGSLHDVAYTGVTGGTYVASDTGYSSTGAAVVQETFSASGAEAVRGYASGMTFTSSATGEYVVASDGQTFSFVASANTTLTGGGSYETFVFGPGFGQSRITDFIPNALSNTNHNVIKFGYGAFTDFNDLLSRAVQSGSNTLITDRFGDVLTLQGVLKSKLTASDFVFSAKLLVQINNAGGVTNQATQTIAGTGDVGTTVKLLDGTTQLGTAVVGTDGNWSFSVTLSEGQHVLVAQNSDLAGNLGTSSALTYTIDTSAPVVVIGSVGGTANVAAQPLFGTGEAGTTVTLFEGNAAIGTALVGADGAWNTVVTLGEGSHVLFAQSTDLAGNVGVSAPVNYFIDTLPPVTTIANTGGLINKAMQTITGTGEIGTTVMLFDGTALIGTALVGTDGSWSSNVKLNGDGAHSLIAQAVDAAGNIGISNSASFTLDATAPAVTIANAGGLTNSTAQTIVGHVGLADAGTTISIFEGTTQVATAVADANGTWTANVTLNGEGVHTFVAQATDVAGNLGSTSVVYGLTSIPVTADPSAAFMMGVNLPQAAFYQGVGNPPIWPSSSDLDYFASKGLSLVRVAFTWEAMQSTLGGALDPTQLAKLEAFITDAAARGMQVIVDLHSFGAYNGAVLGSYGLSIASFQDFWTKLADALKGYSNIYGYDIMNEPHGLPNASVWPAAAQAAVDGIRSVDMVHTIIVEGDAYASAAGWLRLNSNLLVNDPTNNILYQAHVYFDKDGSGTYKGTYDQEGAYAMTGVDSLEPFAAWLQANNVKGFIGEFGVPDNDPRWLTVLDNFMAAMKADGISGTYWAAGNWSGHYPLSVEPINGLDAVQLATLLKYGGAGTSVNLNIAQVVAIENGALILPVVKGTTVNVSDTAAHIAALTPAQIAGMAALGITSVSSITLVTLTLPQQRAFGAASISLSEKDAAGSAQVWSWNTDGTPHDVYYHDVIGQPYADYYVLYANGLPASARYSTGLNEKWTYFAPSANRGYTMLDQVFDVNSKLLQQTTVNGAVVTSVQTYNGDGSVHEIITYGILGQPYTSSDVLYGTNGKQASATYSNGMTAAWTYNPDGSYELIYNGITGQSYTMTDTVYGVSGKAISQIWSKAGVVTKSETWNADGSVHDIHFYGVTGQAYTDYDVVYGANGQQASATYSNGLSQSWFYNADGSLHEAITTGISGQKWTATDIVYGANGKAVSQVWSNGTAPVKTQTWNSDGSVHDIHNYGITGQPYTDYDVIYGVNGKASSATYSNGMTQTWTYNADGSLHDMVYAGITTGSYVTSDTGYKVTGETLVVETATATGAESIRGYASGLTFISSSAGELVVASDGQKFVFAASANTTLTGGGSNEVFVFGQGFGQSRVTDFIPNSLANTNHDIIKFGYGAFNDFNDLLSRTFQSGANTIITDRFGDVLTLQNVLKSNLTQSDFVFAAKLVVQIGSPGVLSNQLTLPIAGSGDAGTTVKVFDGSVLVGTALIAGNGSWSTTVALSGEGAHTLVAQNVDLAGNTGISSSVVYTVDTTAPVVTIANAGGLTNQTAQTISGHVGVGDGATVLIFDGTTQIGTAVVGSDGNWATDIVLAGDGAHVLVAKDTDAAGNVGASQAVTYVLDTTPPAIVVSNTSGLSNQVTQTIAGQVGVADAGAVVAILEGTTQLGTAVVGADGSWSASVVLSGDGVHTLVAQASDLFGNVGTSTPVSYTIDTVAPVVTIDGAGGLTNTATQVISGMAGIGDAGTTVTIFDGQAQIGSAVVDDFGYWNTSVTLSGEGTHTLVAKESDAATNVGVSAPTTFTLDTTAPLVTVANSGGPTNQAAQTIFGSVGVGDAGSTIAIFDGSVQLATTVVDSNGYWNADIMLSGDGFHSLIAKTTDIAGNQGASVPVIFTLDTTAPTVTIDSLAGLTNQSTQTIAGHVGIGDAGISVAVFDGQTKLGSALVGADGSWSLNVALSGDGAHTLFGIGADAVGNIGSSSPITYTLDTKAPVVTVGSSGGAINQATQTIFGSVDAQDGGTTVAIFDGATQLGTALVGSDGSWSTNVTLSGDGTHTLVAKDADFAGNMASSAPVTYTLNTTTQVVVNGIMGQKFTSTVTVYDSSGKLISQTWLNGANLVQTDVRNPDGSLHDSHFYGVTGQAYTDYQIFYGLNGKAINEVWNNGSTIVKTEAWNTDGSIHDIHYYGVTGQPYTDYDVFYGANGREASATYSNGMTQTWLYNSDGSLHETLNNGITGQRYTSTDIIYGSNGKAVSESWSAGSTIVKTEAWNTDGSIHDIHYYGVTGQPYTDYSVSYATNGKPGMASYSNGMTQTWTYNSDGSLHDVAYAGIASGSYVSSDTGYASNGATIVQQTATGAGAEAIRGFADGLTFTSSPGGETVVTSDGQSFNFARTANSTLTGGGSNETFVFEQGFGQSKITDFIPNSLANTNHDVIKFGAGAFTDFNDLLSHATQTGANTVIVDHLGDTLTLQSVLKVNLTQSDFIIHA